MQIELGLLNQNEPQESLPATNQRFKFNGDYDEVFEIHATYMRQSTLQKVGVYVLNFFTLGITYLMQRWFMNFRLKLGFSECRLDEMQLILIRKYEGGQLANEILVESDRKQIIVNDQTIEAMVFEFELLRFYFDPSTSKINPIKNDLSSKSCLQISSNRNNDTNRDQLRKTFGENKLDIPQQSWATLLIEEVLSPFNIFQIFALGLWAYDDYAMYAFLIGTITIVQIIYELKELRANQQRIRDMILLETDVLLADNSYIDSKLLVVGDRIKIQNGKVPCDCIIVKGQCIMNEAILTGESVPVVKEALPKETKLFEASKMEKHIIFNGTQCLQSTDAEAIVYQVGFQTMKGSLCRSILFNKSKSFSFKEDSVKYLLVLSAIGIIQLGFSIYITLNQGYSIKKAIIRGLEVITICVPPQLPAALNAGIQLAINRLEDKNISCIKPDKVNVGGIVNVCAFDKTGTLTESGLEVYGCKPAKENGFAKRCQSSDLGQNSPLFWCLGSCHSLSLIGEEIMGDPLDLKMFESTKLKLQGDEAIGESVKLRILKRFDFLSELQRMSVLCQTQGKQYVFTKGSPEVISKLCNRVPSAHDFVLRRYALKGLRVISCAYRKLDDQNFSREKLECNLTFLGFLIFENQLKPETAGAIMELKNSKFLNVMVTGDNELTAINVGKNCSIIGSQHIYIAKLLGGQYETLESIEYVALRDLEIQDGEKFDNQSVYSIKEALTSTEDRLSVISIIKMLDHEKLSLVMTGSVYDHLMKFYTQYPEFQQDIDLIIQNTQIFARMKPNQKGDYVRQMRKVPGTAIAFCGDGTNDTCALRNGDLGLALSLEDASLAAPFTSREFNISAMVRLIKECRASLVTCVECFKFMTLYSIIQATAVIILYQLKGDLTQWQYLYQDLWLIIPLALSMDLTKASDELADYRPISRLISFPILLSVIGQSLFIACSQVALLFYLFAQDFYVPYDILHKDVVKQDEPDLGFENSCLIIIANTQVLSVALAFTRGPPFREAIYKNKHFVFVLLVGLIGHLIVILYPELWIVQYLEICRIMPIYFRLELLGYSILTGVICYVFERKVVEHYIMKESNF